MSSVGSGGVADISMAVQSTAFSVSVHIVFEHLVTSCDHTGVPFHYT